MTRLIVVAAAAIGLILFVAFIAARLVRSRTRGLSVRMQVFLALAAIVGAFAFGLGLMVIDRIEARAVRFARQAASDEAETVAVVIARDLESGDATLADLARGYPNPQTGRARFELRDKSGKVLIRSIANEPEDGTVAASRDILVRGERVGSVRVVKRTIVMRRLLEDFAPTVLVISLVLGAAAAIAAAIIGRAIASPIEALTAFSERVSDGEREGAPPGGFGREVKRLTRSIDSMRRQLEGRPFVETFAADLSHELKNPVAAIRASAEVLDDGAIDEPEEARRFVRRIREATARIELLLRELLSLAEIEARGVERFAAVDLSAVVQRAVAALERDRDRVAVELRGDGKVRGDEAWLARAVTNLIENALVHSKPGTPVTVSVKRDASEVSVEVENPGAVPKHTRKIVFRRFVTTRADKGGTGLGLAIVRAVAEAHSGRAELVEAGPPRVRFRLALPPAKRRARETLMDAVDEVTRQPRSEAGEETSLIAQTKTNPVS